MSLSQQAEGIQIDGKVFEFVRITPNSQQRILKKMRLSNAEKMQMILSEKQDQKIPLKKFELILLSRLLLTEQKRMWLKVRDCAFKKNFAWRFLKIVPKQLRSSRITLALSGEIQASFFDYWKAAVSEYNKHLKRVNDSQTEKK